MKAIKIDRKKCLQEEQNKGHNRWHPDIPPILEVEPGEEIALDVRDALDGQILPELTPAELLYIDTNVVHPLTGPIYINGANPGDLLEIEYLEITPQPHGFTLFRPGSGFLGDLFKESYIAHWNIEGGSATSPQLPGVRIPDGSFMGTAGVAPSHKQLKEWTYRERLLVDQGNSIALPSPTGAIPKREPIGSEGLRTVPPRENCGNVDIKQLTKGSKLFIPVNVPGALYSVGDGHFAQGDSECCLTAIEVGTTIRIKFQLHKELASGRQVRFPMFTHRDYFNSTEWLAPKRFTATMGMPIHVDGTNENGNLNLAARNALLEMLYLLHERGWTLEQAYIICSVAVDLKISNIVNMPNVIVSAFLSENIFE
jgi:formamidase